MASRNFKAILPKPQKNIILIDANDNKGKICKTQLQNFSDVSDQAAYFLHNGVKYKLNVNLNEPQNTVVTYKLNENVTPAAQTEAGAVYSKSIVNVNINIGGGELSTQVIPSADVNNAVTRSINQNLFPASHENNQINYELPILNTSQLSQQNQNLAKAFAVLNNQQIVDCADIQAVTQTFIPTNDIQNSQIYQCNSSISLPQTAAFSSVQPLQGNQLLTQPQQLHNIVLAQPEVQNSPLLLQQSNNVIGTKQNQVDNQPILGLTGTGPSIGNSSFKNVSICKIVGQNGEIGFLTPISNAGSNLSQDAILSASSANNVLGNTVLNNQVKYETVPVNNLNVIQSGLPFNNQNVLDSIIQSGLPYNNHNMLSNVIHNRPSLLNTVPCPQQMSLMCNSQQVVDTNNCNFQMKYSPSNNQLAKSNTNYNYQAVSSQISTPVNGCLTYQMSHPNTNYNYQAVSSQNSTPVNGCLTYQMSHPNTNSNYVFQAVPTQSCASMTESQSNQISQPNTSASYNFQIVPASMNASQNNQIAPHCNFQTVATENSVPMNGSLSLQISQPSTNSNYIYQPVPTQNSVPTYKLENNQIQPNTNLCYNFQNVPIQNSLATNESQNSQTSQPNANLQIAPIQNGMTTNELQNNQVSGLLMQALTLPQTQKTSKGQNSQVTHPQIQGHPQVSSQSPTTDDKMIVQNSHKVSSVQKKVASILPKPARIKTLGSTPTQSTSNLANSETARRKYHRMRCNLKNKQSESDEHGSSQSGFVIDFDCKKISPDIRFTPGVWPKQKRSKKKTVSPIINISDSDDEVEVVPNIKCEDFEWDSMVIVENDIECS